MAEIDIDIEYISKKLNSLSNKFSNRSTKAYNNAAIFKNDLPYSIKSKPNINKLLNNLKSNCHIIEDNFGKLERNINNALQNYLDTEEILVRKMKKINKGIKKEKIKKQKIKPKTEIEYMQSKNSALQQVISDMNNMYQNDDIRITDMTYERLYESTNAYVTGICSSLVVMTFDKQKDELNRTVIKNNQVDGRNHYEEVYANMDGTFTKEVENKMGNIKVVNTAISITNEMINKDKNRIENKTIEVLSPAENIHLEQEKKKYTSDNKLLNNDAKYEEKKSNSTNMKNINNEMERKLKNVEAKIKEEQINSTENKLNVEDVDFKEVEVLTINDKN